MRSEIWILNLTGSENDSPYKILAHQWRFDMPIIVFNEMNIVTIVSQTDIFFYILYNTCSVKWSKHNNHVVVCQLERLYTWVQVRPFFRFYSQKWNSFFEWIYNTSAVFAAKEEFQYEAFEDKTFIQISNFALQNYNM